MRSVEHLGRSSFAKNPINAEKVKCDGPTDGPTDRRTDGPSKRGVESRSTRLKNRVNQSTGQKRKNDGERQRKCFGGKKQKGLAKQKLYRNDFSGDTPGRRKDRN